MRDKIQGEIIEDTSQTYRIIKMLSMFSSGRKLTTSELYRHFAEQVSLRTIQRDLHVIMEAGIPLLSERYNGKESKWFFSREYRNMLPLVLKNNELISLYILKSYLKNFNNTAIWNDLGSLLEKLEDAAPGDIYSDISELQSEVLVNEECGALEYGNFDATINKIISIILRRQWCRITYESLTDNKTRTYTVFPQKIFSNNSTLYAIVYFPKHKDHLALAIHQIRQIEEQQDVAWEIPAFNYDEFRKKRFGVFLGDIENVVISVSPPYVKWFKNRLWHPTQKQVVKDDSSLEISMDVPLSPDFITWILGWHDGIKVKSPDKLISMIKEKLTATMDLY